MINEIIGLNIRARRKKMGIKQKDLAAMVGLCKYSLIKIEQGVMPTKGNLKNVQNALRMSDQELFNGTAHSYETIYYHGVTPFNDNASTDAEMKQKPEAYAYTAVAEILAQELANRCITASDLVKLTGLSRHTIERVLHDDYVDKATTLKHAHLICNCTGIPYELITCSLDAMFNDIDNTRRLLIRDITKDLANCDINTLIKIKEMLK